MPKKVDSFFISSKGLDLISNFCEDSDISEAAFSRKFNKHNRWISDLKRGRSMPTREDAAKICVLLGVSPDEIIERNNPKKSVEETEADISIVRDFMEQQRKAEGTAHPTEPEDKETAELREIWSSADDEERKVLLEMARLIKQRRK